MHYRTVMIIVTLWCYRVSVAISVILEIYRSSWQDRLCDHSTTFGHFPVLSRTSVTFRGIFGFSGDSGQNNSERGTVKWGGVYPPSILVHLWCLRPTEMVL